jgi:hypothetical protein
MKKTDPKGVYLSPVVGPADSEAGAWPVTEQQLWGPGPSPDVCLTAQDVEGAQ